MTWNEIEYLRSLQDAGIKELTPEMQEELDVAGDLEPDRAGQWETYHAVDDDIGRRSRNLMRFARSSRMPMAGLVILAVLVIIVISMALGPRRSPIEIRLDEVLATDQSQQAGERPAAAVESSATEADTGAPVDAPDNDSDTSGDADLPGGAEADGDEATDDEEVPVGEEVADANDDAVTSEDPVALRAGPYSGAFDGPVFDGADGVVGPGSTVELVLGEDGAVAGSVDFDIMWGAEAFECQPGPDEYVGDVGPVDVSGGSGAAAIVLERFFPACADPSLSETIAWEGVFHVVVSDGSLVGGIEFGGALGLPWEATPDS